MKVTEYEVGDVTCIDVDGKTKGILIGCEGQNYVSLVCDSSIPHEETDELARLLRKMKLNTVVVQNGY